MTERARQTIDWRRVHEGLAASRSRLEEGAEPTAEASRQILARRAEALAQPLAEAATPAAALELLVFSAGHGRYAVEASRVVDVFPLLDPTPVPCTPPTILGVVSHRGRIIPLVDVGQLLEPAEGAPAEARFVVAVEKGGICLGLRAESVAGLVRVEERDVLAPDHVAPETDAVVRGVTETMASVLDVEALAHDPRIQVNEEID